MKSKKKRYTLYGRLLRPLEVGQMAALIADGQVYCTSPVVTVDRADSRRVCFETRDGRYSLSLRPLPPAASRSFSAMPAA